MDEQITPLIISKVPERKLQLHTYFSLARRQIPYVIASQYKDGYLSKTFTWDSIARSHAIMEQFWNIKFVRVNSISQARVTYLQANTNLGANVAAVANKGQLSIKLNPTFNYGLNRAYCTRIMLHEFGHLAYTTAHLPDVRALMHAYGGNIRTYTPADEKYWSAYAWLSSARPSQNPTLFDNTLSQERGLHCLMEKSWANKYGKYMCP